MKPVRLAHRAEYLLARTLEGSLTALPERAAERLAAALGSLLESPLAIRRATVLANLRRAFPEAGEPWIRVVASGAYRHLAREVASIARLARLTPAEIVARTRIEGWGELESALAERRGVILATGHFGNWEIGAAAIAARGVPTSAIVKRQSNPLVNAYLEATRRRLGVEPIYRSDAARLVPRALRAGRVIGIVADQDARAAGVWVPFFGVPSSTHRGPALFALRLGAPIFAGAAFRVAGERRYRIVLERVLPRQSGSLAEDVAALTARLTERLEAAVRAAPDQYFWFHRRWKATPPAELTPEPPVQFPRVS
jgi:Kdo2-lipid IVA lauroyltransferase/acyltransferase